MTPDEIEKDRTEGTPGPWIPLGQPTAGFMAVKAQPGPLRGFTKYICILDGIEASTAERGANARRIARLPELEQAYLDLTAENAALKQRIAELKKRNDTCAD